MRFLSHHFLVAAFLWCNGNHAATAQQLRAAQNSNGFSAERAEEVPSTRRTAEGRDVDTLIMSFQEAKARFVKKLLTDYGEGSFEQLFSDKHPNATVDATTSTTSSIGRNAFYVGTKNAPKSWERTKRKMMIRILEYMIEGKVKDFVWATAGDSGAAGHGNFFDQQYTRVMQRQAADLFNAVGLNFVARPYAMHSSTSAPELAVCVREIYGEDVDIITWDFPMTDGRWHWRLEFFGHRVMLLKKHPTMLVLRAGLDVERQSTVEHLTEEGMAALRLDESYMTRQKAKFPDSHYRTEDELAQMTDYTRYFRCGKTIETGEGGCLDHKFTHNGTCDDRIGQNNWHNGWKWHAYYGNLYTLFLMEVIDDALAAIKTTGGDIVNLYKDLEAQEDDLFQAFESSRNFKYAHKWDVDSLDTALFYHDRVYCHTARLPAETRYKGYVFGKNLVSEQNDWNNFKKGLSIKRLNLEPMEEMRIAYVSREMHQCESTLTIDSRDFFLATSSFGDYQNVNIPNTQEFLTYGPHKPNGLIGVCAAACTHEKCKGIKLLGAVDINKGEDVIMQVNGERVAEAKRFDDCFILKREDGSFYWPTNADGRFTIGVKVLHPHKFFRISSFIVW